MGEGYGAWPTRRAWFAQTSPGRVYSPAVGKKLVVTVRWTDDKTDVFDDVEPVHVAYGVLTIRERKPWFAAGSAESWHLSMANIRSSLADWVKHQ